MKTSTIFWGVFLITLGVMLLISSLNSFALDMEFVFKLWPLLFIFWGITLLKISAVIKRIVVILISILLAFFIVAVVNSGVSGVKNLSNLDWDINLKNDDEGGSFLSKDSIFLPLDSNQFERNIDIDVGAGSFSLEDNTEHLIEVIAKSEENIFNLKADSLNRNISLSITEAQIKFDSKSGGGSRIAIVRLNQNPVWNFKINLGAAKMSADFSKIKSKRIELESGAASSVIKLGELLDTCDVSVNAGASSVKIEVPKNYGCIVETDIALSSKKFEGFSYEGKNYVSDNYRNNPKMIFIRIKGGVSSFKITRY